MLLRPLSLGAPCHTGAETQGLCLLTPHQHIMDPGGPTSLAALGRGREKLPHHHAALLRVLALFPPPRYLFSSRPSCTRAPAQAHFVADPSGLLSGAETHFPSIPGSSGSLLMRRAHSPHPVPRPWATSASGTRT